MRFIRAKRAAQQWRKLHARAHQFGELGDSFGVVSQPVLRPAVSADGRNGDESNRGLLLRSRFESNHDGRIITAAPPTDCAALPDWVQPGVSGPTLSLAIQIHNAAFLARGQCEIS